MAKKKSKSDTKVEIDAGLFSKTLDIINNEFGDQVIKSLDSMLLEPYTGISSGSLMLDYIINPEAGGMPKGQVLEIWGPYSSGKTTIALGLCANATANGGRVVYLDAERALKPKSITDAGVDSSLFHVVKHTDARVSANILEKLIKTGEVTMAVIDSVPAWTPVVEAKSGEDEADFTKPKIAFQSSFLTVALAHLVQVSSDYGVTLVLINQQRNNLGSYMGGVKPFGGHALDHYSSIRLKLSGSARSTQDRIVDSDGNLVGQYTTVVTDKNKTFTPFKEARVPLFLGRGVNPYLELVGLAVQAGILEGTSGRFKWKGKDEQLAHGANNLAQMLYDDSSLYLDLRTKVIEALGIKYSEDIKIVNAFHDESGIKRKLDESE